MYRDYPPNTYIRSVLVGGDGHGQNFLESPADSHIFKVIKRPPVRFNFTESSIPEDWPPLSETIYYEVFAEIWIRNKIIWLHRVRDYQTDSTSILQIADALRIAGIDEL